MNTFWLKVAAIAAGVVVVIVLVGVFTSSPEEPTPKPPPKTIYDVAQEDKDKYLSKPEPAEATQPQTQEGESENAEGTSARSGDSGRPQPAQPKKVTLYFTKLSEIEDIEAERLLHVAVPGRSIGRLPMTGYNLMIENCRQIIQRWPGSWYAYRAKQMLADIPQRYHSRYHITEEELDMSIYTQPRPGTVPFVVEEAG